MWQNVDVSALPSLSPPLLLLPVLHCPQQSNLVSTSVPGVHQRADKQVLFPCFVLFSRRTLVVIGFDWQILWPCPSCKRGWQSEHLQFPDSISREWSPSFQPLMEDGPTSVVDWMLVFSFSKRTCWIPNPQGNDFRMQDPWGMIQPWEKSSLDRVAVSLRSLPYKYMVSQMASQRSSDSASARLLISYSLAPELREISDCCLSIQVRVFWLW